jgi:hypothetical protein
MNVGKLGIVLRLMVFVAGACPMPMPYNQIDEGVHQQLLKGLKLPFPLGFLILGGKMD